MAQAPATAERTLGPTEQLLATAVARRFYLDGRTKVEIAAELGLSRFKVARVLEQAREAGLVRIEIGSPPEIDAERSEALQARLGLQTVLVVDAGPGDADQLRRHVGRMAARLLAELLGENEVLGIAWGRSLAEMTKALPPLPRCTVVQLCGALGGAASGPSPVELVSAVARASGGRGYPLHAPLVVTDAAASATLRRQPEVAAAIERFDDVTTAVISIGAWGAGLSTVRDALEPDEQERIAQLGACAEACGLILDADGKELDALTDRIIGISGAQLSRVPRVIGLAYSAPKARAVAAMARSGLLHCLVTDDTVARELLREPPLT